MKDSSDVTFYFAEIAKFFKKSFAKELDSNIDYSMRECGVIEFLFDGPLTMSELAHQMDLTPGTITPLVDKLIEKKLVKREEDSNDRRKIYILLDKKGEMIGEALLKIHGDLSSILLNKLDLKEREKFQLLLKKIVENLWIEIILIIKLFGKQNIYKSLIFVNICTVIFNYFVRFYS